MKRIACLAATLLVAACSTGSGDQQTTSGARPPVAAAASPNGLTPVTAVPRQLEAPLIRVGLLSDQTTAAFPRVDGGYAIVTQDGAAILRRGFTVRSPLDDTKITWGVQVAALSDKESAEALAARIQSETGQRTLTVFDAGGGVYKIVSGSFATEDEARPLRGRLTDAGYAKDMLIVKRPSDQQFERAVVLTDDEGQTHRIAGDSFLVVPASAETIRIGTRPYRGGARVFINPRGLLNIINELNLDDYVRGVLPAEMGPKTFDELEGLKAQALAARTYGVNRMGDFRSEGYDICPTPACQVYEGFSIEDPLSNQAVAETAGMIITYGGKPIDALFTSTCGGETSDVGTMFPGRNEPYLRRARCVEEDLHTIDGVSDGPLMTATQTRARIFAAVAGPFPTGRWSAGDVASAVARAATVAGVALGDAGAPASSRRGDVLTWLSRVWKLDAAVEALTLPEDRRYYFPGGSPEDPAYRAAAFLIKYRILPPQGVDSIDLTAAMPREELHAILYSWLEEQQALKETSGKIFSVEGRRLALKSAGKTTSHEVAAGIPMFRQLEDRIRESRNVTFMIGDRASLIQDRSGRVVAATIHANYDGASFDRTSNFANWTRTYREEELVPMISRRNAITELTDLRPVVTDASKRVAELDVIAENGRAIRLKGLPVRWSLGLPDNLFVMQKSQDADGADRYTFYGKGWGHGIGMCQVGAYGMAFRGMTAEQIVKRYYTGVEVEKYTGQ